jgi:hypothetical protein
MLTPTSTQHRDHENTTVAKFGSSPVYTGHLGYFKNDSHLMLYSTDMRRLTTVKRSEKCVVRRLRRCANVIDCTYTNLDSKI